MTTLSDPEELDPPGWCGKLPCPGHATTAAQRSGSGWVSLVAALIAHQRHTIGSCRCGWGELGRSHCEHVAGIIRPLVEAEVRERVAREIQEHCDTHARCCDQVVDLIRSDA